MIRAILLLLVVGMSGRGALLLAQDDLIEMTVMCRCIEGGPNSSIYVWLRNYVIPTFEEWMAQDGLSVHVSIRSFEEGDEALREVFRQEITGNGEADLMAFDGFWIPDFYASGLVKPLTEIVGPEVNDWDGWDHIPDPIEQLLVYDGQRFGIPNGTDVRVIFYRTDLFEQAGIALPWQPQSWADILTAGEQLRVAGVPVPIQLNAGTAMGEATTMQGYFMALLGTGEHMYDFEQDKWIVSSPGILETLRFYQTIYADDALGSTDLQLAADGREQSFTAFSQGRVGILIEGDFFWRSILFTEMGVEARGQRVGWAMMPAEEPGRGYRGQDYVTISGGGGWILNPNTGAPEVAWKLLSHMAEIDAVRAFQLAQPRISVRNDVATAGDPTMTAMADAMLTLSTVRPQLPEYSAISVEVQRMTERVVSGEMTPEDAMAAYAEAVIALVGEDNTLTLSQ